MLFRLLPLASTGMLLLAQSASAQNAANGALEAVITSLPAPQFAYQMGTAVMFQCPYPVDMANKYQVYLGSCFGNNTATPYIITAPPPSPGGMNGLPGYITAGFNEGTTSSPAYDFYQLGPNEALVTIITLPPKAAFYSFQSYEFERQDTSQYDMPPPGTQCSPGTGYSVRGSSTPHKLSYDCKYEEFGYFTNAINNTDVLARSLTPFNTNPSSPTEAIAVITTANDDVYKDLMVRFGNLANRVFPDAMSIGAPAPLEIGLSTTSDIFGSIFRLTLPQSYTDSLAWKMGVTSSASSNVVVYRIQDTTVPSGPYNLYGGTKTAPALLANSFNTREVPLSGSRPTCPDNPRTYYCDIMELGGLLKQYLVGQNYPTNYTLIPTVATFPGESGTDGPTCILNGSPCAGGTQDTAGYPKLGPYVLNPGTPVFMIGVDHATATNNSTSPVNNADYIGSSVTVDAGNIGIADAVDLNVPQTFTTGSVTNGPNNSKLTNYLAGSGSSVVTMLGNAGYHASQALINDAQNLYVAGFVRLATNGSCSGVSFFCVDSAPVKTYPFVTYISSSSTVPPYIAPADAVDFTERAYSLPPTSSPVQPATGAKGIAVQPPFGLYVPATQ